MSDRNPQELEFRIRDSIFESSGSLPKTPDAAIKSGAEYYETFLKPVMPGLAKEITKIQSETGMSSPSTACVFLERDARPAMLAWNELVTGSSLTTFAIPASRFVMQELYGLYNSFEDAHLRQIKNPDEWSRLWNEKLDSFMPYSPDARKWINAFRQSHAEKLKNSKLMVVIDIGYHGSAVEIGRYLLNKAFPEKIVKSVLLYRYSDNIPIRCVRSNETTWYAEEIPHTTMGYGLTESKYRHLKEGVTKRDLEIEKQFYKGVIKEAKKDKEKFRSLSSPAFWAKTPLLE